MKHIIFALLLVLFLGACTQKTGYKISGVASNTKNTELFLEKLSNQNKEVIDTVSLKEDGSFLMEGALEDAGLFRLRDQNQSGILIYLKPGYQVEVEMDFESLNDYTVTGSPETNRFKEFSKFYTDRQTDKQALIQSYREETDSLTKADYLAQLRSWDDDTDEMVKTKITEEPSAILGVFMISALQAKKNKDFYNAFNDRVQLELPNSVYAEEFNNLVAQINSQVDPPNIGEQAPEIAMANTEGEVLKLSDLKGKYVLLDFWAAWCGPCRRENPNIVRAYEEYNDKGFEIFQVSLDRTKQAWQNAIEADNLYWDYHVSDLKYWNNGAAKAYGVKSIPTSYLLDKDGKIIAMNLRGDALDAKLSEIFN